MFPNLIAGEDGAKGYHIRQHLGISSAANALGLRLPIAGAVGIHLHKPPDKLALSGDIERLLVQGGALTEFEKLCDDAVGDYLAGAQFIPFGEAPLVGYLAARETEYTNLRILLMGRTTGLPADVIRARLRESYV